MKSPRPRSLLAAILLAALVLVAALLITLRPDPFDHRTRDSPPSSVAPKGPPTTPIGTTPALDPAAAELLPRLHSPAGSVAEDLQLLDEILRLYRRTNGDNPVGDNPEITSALLGDNPAKAAFLQRDRNQVDSAGCLLDRWGTPYFFHALSGTRMEILSAGPDREFHTADDVAGP